MANTRRDLVTSINGDVIEQIYAYRAEIMFAMYDSAMRHGDAIADELKVIATLPALDRARHAIVFSIMSPQCKFDKNVRVTPPLVAAIMNGATQDELRDIIVANGIGLHNAKSEALFNASPTIRHLSENDITRELLMRLRGVNMKASAMTIALFDQNARVYTLDTHMLRGIMQLCGLHKDGTYTITAPAYRKLEAFLLDCYDELAQSDEFNHSIFVTQWALWNDFGFKGVHQVHTPIFGL